MFRLPDCEGAKIKMYRLVIESTTEEIIDGIRNLLEYWRPIMRVGFAARKIIVPLPEMLCPMCKAAMTAMSDHNGIWYCAADDAKFVEDASGK